MLGGTPTLGLSTCYELRRNKRKYFHGCAPIILKVFKLGPPTNSLIGRILGMNPRTLGKQESEVIGIESFVGIGPSTLWHTGATSLLVQHQCLVSPFHNSTTPCNLPRRPAPNPGQFYKSYHPALVSGAVHSQVLKLRPIIPTPTACLSRP